VRCPITGRGRTGHPKQAYIDSTFTAMDTNKDGRVDKSEYAEFQQGRFNKQADSINAAFTAMDKNKDGRISKEEAIVVPEIAKYFTGLDTDGDGYLSLKEMQQAMVAVQTADAPTK
jgi:Ca2+-binding protein (EF-Hand superfamily)